MEPTPLPPELVRKIEHARCLADRPPARRFMQPATVAETLALRARTQPDAPFLTYLAEDGGVRAYTYAEFYRHARRIAALLHAFAGVQRGERIATAMHNHDQAIFIYFAAWHLGASVVPLNMGEDDKRLAYVLEHSGAKVLFVLKDHAARMRPLTRAAPGIRFVINVDGEPSEGETSLQSVLPPVDVPQFDAPENVRPDDEALIVYTSGTTGVPKGVALSQYNLLADACAITQWHGFTPQTRMMCVLPVHHVNGLVVTHVTPLYFGGSVVLNRKFSAQNFFATAAQHRVEVVSVVPTLLQFLLEATPPGFESRASVPSLQYLICGAGPLTVDLAARFEDRFGIPICHGYGLSETTCYSCFVPVTRASEHAGTGGTGVLACQNADDGRGRPSHPWSEHKRWMRDYGYPSIGVPVAANHMAIHDEHGTALPEGAKGEIVIRGHNVMLGYHDNLQANENAFTHAWFRSGDEGFFKLGSGGEMYFFISGRFKELIIRGGVKISPLEVDEALNRIPGVKAAMAVGFENVTYGEEVGAYVVRAAGSSISADEVLAACRAALPFAMSPKAVVFGETFPVTSTGKYQRNQLKHLFAHCQGIQFREK